ALDQHAAAATHPCAIDHDRIQTDHGADPLFARHVGDRSHHRDRSDREHLIDARSVFDQLAQPVGDQSRVAVTAVVGGDIDRVADLAHLVFQKDEVLVASAKNGDDAIAGALHGGGGRIRHRGADASAHHDDRAKVLDLRGLAQRPDNVEDAVAGLERVEKICGLADRLHDDVDRAFFRIGAFDGERDTLAFLVDPDNDELPRPLLACDARRLDNEALDSRGDELCVDDFEHGNSVEIRVLLSRGRVTWGCDGNHKLLFAAHAGHPEPEVVAFSYGWGFAVERAASSKKSIAASLLMFPDLRTRILQFGREGGFELCGIAPVRAFGELEVFPSWIADGRHGEMKYMEARNEAGELKRARLANVASWARSVIVCAVNY